MFERVIDDDFELTEKVCAIFMRQICEGVDYMHQKFIMHLDMKPENILCVTRTGNRIKLIDFGLARHFDPTKSLQVMFGTPDFASPEVLSFDRVTPAADMWSVGVICYVLLSGFSPFLGNSDLETMTNVTKAIYDFDDESFDPISSEAKDFIARLLIKDPSKRLKPAQCLDHKWLAKTPTKKGKVTKLSKTKLKKYVVRRRWQKAVTAIMALRRMGANLSLSSGTRKATTTVAPSAKLMPPSGSSSSTTKMSHYSSSIGSSGATPKTSTTGGSSSISSASRLAHPSTSTISTYTSKGTSFSSKSTSGSQTGGTTNRSSASSSSSSSSSAFRVTSSSTTNRRY